MNGWNYWKYTKSSIDNTHPHVYMCAKICEQTHTCIYIDTHTYEYIYIYIYIYISKYIGWRNGRMKNGNRENIRKKKKMYYWKKGDERNLKEKRKNRKERQYDYYCY